MRWQEEFQRWIDISSEAFGGLDICGLDFVHSEQDGKYYILELNDTAIGLVHKYEEEDMKYMRDLVLYRWEQHLSSSGAAPKTEDKEEKKSKKKKKSSASSSSPSILDNNTKEVEKLKEQLALLEIELKREKDTNARLVQSAQEDASKKQKKGFFGK